MEGPGANSLPSAPSGRRLFYKKNVNRGKARQNNSFWLGQIRSSYMLGESRDFVENYDDMVKAVTSADIKALAKKYVDLKNYVVVTLRPEDASAGSAE